MQTVDIERAMHQSPPPGVQVGSLVKVKTLDRREVSFRVTDFSPDGLTGSYGFFAYQDMRSLKVEQPENNDEVMGWVLGLLGLAALVALVANADAVAICSPSPCGSTVP